MKTARLLALAAAALTLTAGCATSSDGADDVAAAPSSTSTGTPAAELRLGYFPNVTHATAVYGDASGTFQKALGSTKLTTQQFNAGPAAVEALFGGALDATYIGPNPAINAYLKSKADGGAIRIVAGAVSGGAQLVVKPTITSAKDLKGKRIASPQTGGTQDIALRSYLKDNGYDVAANGAGDVTVVAQENPQTLTAFKAGQVDGAWLPEPWASRLVLEAGAKVLVDEKDLWPGGKFVTTHLVVRTDYLREHPQTVKALIEGSVAANKALASDPKARDVVGAKLAELTGKPLPAPVLERAFGNITPTDDPLATALATNAEHAFATGLVKKGDLTGIYDLTLLREVLGTQVDDAGLGGSS